MPDEKYSEAASSVLDETYRVQITECPSERPKFSRDGSVIPADWRKSLSRAMVLTMAARNSVCPKPVSGGFLMSAPSESRVSRYNANA